MDDSQKGPKKPEDYTTVVQNLARALKEHLYGQVSSKTQETSIIRPLSYLKEQVATAWKAKLDRKEECSFAGSSFLYTVLEEKNQRFASSVDEANELWLVGTRLADYLWGLLESSKGDYNFYNTKIQEISNFLLQDLIGSET